MPYALHSIEIALIRALQNKPATHRELADAANLEIDQVRRGAEWLRHKGLAAIQQAEKQTVRLGKNGVRAAKTGLPERRLLEMVSGKSRSIDYLKSRLGPDFGPAMGIARQNGWIKVGRTVAASKLPGTIPAEDLLRDIAAGADPKQLDQTALNSLASRPDYIILENKKEGTISLTEATREINLDGMRSEMDVEADVPIAYPARRHPLKEVIDEIREAFVALGFAEIAGGMAQSSFWNFDALFTPQDHPAREMQDTFFLDMKARNMASDSAVKSVAKSHENVWNYKWSLSAAEKMVLRTHTTCVTIKHLADAKPDEARVFSLGRVFRNEKVSYKHLVEFHQIEGVVTGRNATLRDLMGIQREFYRMIGLEKIKFWPTFFPYTEPSLQSMVYSEELGRWIELFGMGIFRPQVTLPLGIRQPVLAWGGGIERIAMLKYGMDDVREFYGNDMGWLRRGARCP